MIMGADPSLVCHMSSIERLVWIVPNSVLLRLASHDAQGTDECTCISAVGSGKLDYDALREMSICAKAQLEHYRWFVSASGTLRMV